MVSPEPHECTELYKDRTDSRTAPHDHKRRPRWQWPENVGPWKGSWNQPSLQEARCLTYLLGPEMVCSLRMSVCNWKPNSHRAEKQVSSIISATGQWMSLLHHRNGISTPRGLCTATCSLLGYFNRAERTLNQREAILSGWYHIVIYIYVLSFRSSIAVPGSQLPNSWNFPKWWELKGVSFLVDEVTFGKHLRVGAGCQWRQPCDEMVGTFGPSPRPRGPGGWLQSPMANDLINRTYAIKPP